MSKRKANIRPDLIGELFTDGQDYFKLIDCQSEPSATFENINYPSPDKNIITKPISFFASFVQLKPVRPVEKPKQTKKTRADLGGTHKRVKKDEPEIADKKGDDLTIHVPTGIGKDTEYKVNIAGVEVKTPQEKGLKFAVLEAIEKWGGHLPDKLSGQERVTIQGILEQGA